MIDLVRTNATGEERARRCAILLEQRDVDPLLQLDCELSSWKVLLDLEHGFFLDARMVGDVHIAAGVAATCCKMRRFSAHVPLQTGARRRVT